MEISWQMLILIRNEYCFLYIITNEELRKVLRKVASILCLESDRYFHSFWRTAHVLRKCCWAWQLVEEPSSTPTTALPLASRWRAAGAWRHFTLCKGVCFWIWVLICSMISLGFLKLRLFNYVELLELAIMSKTRFGKWNLQVSPQNIKFCKKKINK